MAKKVTAKKAKTVKKESAPSKAQLLKLAKQRLAEEKLRQEALKLLEKKRKKEASRNKPKKVKAEVVVLEEVQVPEVKPRFNCCAFLLVLLFTFSLLGAGIAYCLYMLTKSVFDENIFLWLAIATSVYGLLLFFISLAVRRVAGSLASGLLVSAFLILTLGILSTLLLLFLTSWVTGAIFKLF